MGKSIDWRALNWVKTVKFENSAEGFNFFLRGYRGDGRIRDRVMVGLEPTGHYWFTLAAHLQGVILN